eukprot:TRINITY_DN67710_c0_g1_i1.p1 TRINITY_DN67710_c0_g1~~TRINITY_DN67710_c0_g1_i1.p1  ORF type:complete len:976 (+),score=101.91 TRINITY_DN67710_c0_g1_i1:204-3131(+)
MLLHDAAMSPDPLPASLVHSLEIQDNNFPEAASRVINACVESRRLQTVSDPRLTFAEVLAAERRLIAQMNAERSVDGRTEGVPFSLALSGGGMRAAAFQSGVLWSLAHANLLKNVEYISAVSGGAYIASAFASHCLAAAAPAPRSVRTFYLGVVAKTICRMQTNAGNFVRDSLKHPGYPKDGAGCLPRILDLPILILTLGITIVMNPIVFVGTILVPFALSIELFFGSAMRAAFCITDPDLRVSVFRAWSPLDNLLATMCWMTALTFVLFVVSKLLSCCKIAKTGDGEWFVPTWYLLGHAANACLVRATLALIVLIALVILVPLLQSGIFAIQDNPVELRQSYCSTYVAAVLETTGREGYFDGQRCDAFHGRTPWYAFHDFEGYHVFAGKGERNWTDTVVAPRNVSLVLVGASATGGSGLKPINLVGIFMNLMMMGFGLALCITPLFGSGLLRKLVIYAGPLFLFLLMLIFVRFCIFGPLEQDANVRERLGRWTDNLVTCSLFVALILVPFYEEIRAGIMHKYYRRTLQANFFHGGTDRSLRDLASCPLLPFMLLTGTCSDYQTPGHSNTISELSFSALHTGSVETGYMTTPACRSLAKCTALSAAGCLDAVSLSMTDAIAMRFWLEVLNFSWGDFINFREPRKSVLEPCVKRFGVARWEGEVYRFLLRAPSTITLMSVFLLLSNCWRLLVQSEIRCTEARYRFTAALLMFAIIVFLSFFSFVPVLDILTLSPLIRQIHQATRFFHVGNVPPRMLYITDGGVRDCTAVLQLLRRGCERILLALAASDPDDEFTVLKSAMRCAVEEGLGSFYDPIDPRRPVESLLKCFQCDRTMTFLHIGIHYGDLGGDFATRTGHLFIVKNRLTLELQAQPVLPYLSEEEIRGEGKRDNHDFMEEDWKGLAFDQLGSLGCCDCCHLAGLNCGRKFPHGTCTGFLYMSSQWFNGLARLGFTLTEKAAEAISRTELTARWEAEVDHN